MKMNKLHGQTYTEAKEGRYKTMSPFLQKFQSRQFGVVILFSKTKKKTKILQWWLPLKEQEEEIMKRGS
jgi:hypothetical protein